MTIRAHNNSQCPVIIVCLLYKLFLGIDCACNNKLSVYLLCLFPFLSLFIKVFVVRLKLSDLIAQLSILVLAVETILYPVTKQVALGPEV